MAILLLETHMSRMHILDVSRPELESYIHAHATSWKEFAKTRFGGSIESGEIKVVTGCCRTASWLLGAFRTNERNLTFGVSANAPSARAAFSLNHQNRSMEMHDVRRSIRVGREITEMPSETIPDSYDQTVFVKLYHIGWRSKVKPLRLSISAAAPPGRRGIVKYPSFLSSSSIPATNPSVSIGMMEPMMEPLDEEGLVQVAPPPQPVCSPMICSTLVLTRSLGLPSCLSLARWQTLCESND